MVSPSALELYYDPYDDDDDSADVWSAEVARFVEALETEEPAPQTMRLSAEEHRVLVASAFGIADPVPPASAKRARRGRSKDDDESPPTLRVPTSDEVTPDSTPSIVLAV